jgi:hypothetical protein
MAVSGIGPIHDDGCVSAIGIITFKFLRAIVIQFGD